MRRERFVWLVALASLFLCVGSARADWHAFWNRVHLDWHRNNAWPEPFQTLDRQTTWSHIMAYEVKGWQMENTLTDAHFDPETQAITSAGQAKLWWIITQQPIERRTVFVLLNQDERTTSIRVDSVQQAITRFLPHGPLPQVVRTSEAPITMPGSYAGDIFTKANESRPAPVLPAASTSTN